jgi:hypothetical protein
VFYTFLYLMLPKKGFRDFSGKHNWRMVFFPGMPKALALDKEIKKNLLKKSPKALQAILEETDGSSVYPAFGS